jgi:hypothetical protein
MLPSQYTAGLRGEEKKEHIKDIKEGQKVYATSGKVVERETHAVPKSSHTQLFKRRFGFPITDLTKVKRLFPHTDVEGILAKGRAAYASSGSRPGVSSNQWAYARLASVLTGGKALRIDKDLVKSDMAKILASK